MTQSYTIDLPIPPSTNRLWRKFRGRIVKSPEYKTWITEAGWCIQAFKAGNITGPVEIDIAVGKSRIDLDNQAKSVIDALVRHHIIVGDGPRIVQKVTLRRDLSLPGCRVTVTAIESALRGAA